MKIIFIICYSLYMLFFSYSSQNPVSQQILSEDIKPHGNMEIRNEAGEVLITTKDIESVEASAISDPVSGYQHCVQIKFTEEGTQRFKEATEAHIGEILYIYVDNECISAPYVYSTISDGVAIISGLSSYEEASEIVDAILGY